jgi:hypothetical protein
MHNIAEMHPMGIGKPRTSTAAAEPAGRVVQVELAPGRGLAELELVQVAVLELVIGLAVVPELETAQVAALELVIDQAAVPELVIGLAVVLELVIGPVVAAELQLVQVVAELEHVQGEAALELVRAAVPLRTKSVTAAHRRDLVPRLAAEDLAAEVETTREPAAAEAVIAWEVAE